MQIMGSAKYWTFSFKMNYESDSKVAFEKSGNNKQQRAGEKHGRKNTKEKLNDEAELFIIQPS